MSGNRKRCDTMVCDAHIHIGCYYRRGRAEPCNYTPRRVCSVLKKCGVDEFIYSSRSMTLFRSNYEDVNNEMWEVQNIFGKGAHPFIWVTAQNRAANELRWGFYEGVKLHGLDGSHWITQNPDALEEVLSVAESYNKPVMVHTGCEEDARAANYLPFIVKHPNVRFNLAHGCPAVEVRECMSASDNVFADISLMDPDCILGLLKDGWANRLLSGSDLPAYVAVCGESFTKIMREYVEFYKWLSEKIPFDANFHRYLGQGEK